MPLPETQDAVATLSESGAAPKKRIKTASDLMAEHNRLREEDRESARQRAIAQSLVNGEPPYDDEELQKLGQGDKLNINFGEAEAEMSSAMAPYADMVDSVPRIADIMLDLEDVNERSEKSEIASENWDWMVKQWDDFSSEMQRLALGFVGDGVGVAVFPDTRTWQWETTMLGDFLVPRNTRASDEKIEVATIFRLVDVSTLYNYIRNPEAAKLTGWNVSAVKKAIYQARADQQEKISEAAHWENFQRKIKEHDYETARSYNKVPVVHGYVKEFATKDKPSKVTWVIASDACDKFLCERHGQYDAMNQAFIPFLYGVGSGTFHTIRGLKYKIYNTITVSNRVLCEALEAAMAEGRQLLAGTPEAIQDFQYVQVGGFTLVDSSIQPLPIVQPGAASRMTPVYSLMQQIRQNNTGNYQGRLSPDSGQPISAREASINAMNGSVLDAAAMAQWYTPYSKLLREMFRRTISKDLTTSDVGGQLAKDFLSKCRKQGVTISDLRKWSSVRSVRAIGNGSPAMRNQAQNELIQLSSGFDETGKNNALRDRVAAIPGIGYGAVDRYIPAAASRHTPDYRVALMENSLMQLGVPQEVLGEDNHVEHLSAHFPVIVQTIAAMKRNQLAPDAALSTLRPLVDHATEHVVALSQNAMRQVEAGEMRKQLQNVSAFVNQLEQQVTAKMIAQRDEAQAAAGDQPDPKQAFEIQKLQLKVQEAEAKAQANRELHQQKMDEIRQNMALTDLQAARKIATEEAAKSNPISRIPI